MAGRETGVQWVQQGAEGEGSRPAAKRSPIFPAFLEMRCKYIHYSVIPLMKTDKHFRRSETYFSINFNMEAQAQDAKCEDQPGNRGLGCTRHLLQCPEVTVLTWLLLDGARTLAHSLGNPGDLFKPGPKLGANRSRKRTGFPMSSQTLSGN